MVNWRHIAMAALSRLVNDVPARLRWRFGQDRPYIVLISPRGCEWVLRFHKGPPRGYRMAPLAEVTQ